MSLTEAAAFFKKTFRYLVIGVVALILIWILGGFTIQTIRNILPHEETPTLGFGKLPRPTLPTTITSKGISFTLDTTTGKLPTIPTVLPIYKFDPLTTSLLDTDRAAKTAASFGFTSTPTPLDSENYQFTDPKNSTQRVVANINTQNFSLLSTLSDSSYNKPLATSIDDDFAGAARTILKSHNLLADDLVRSVTTVSYRKISGIGTAPVDSISQANFARVDIFRDSLGNNKYPIVGPMRDIALVNILLSSSKADRSLIELNYFYRHIQKDSPATYPIAPVSAAFDSLKGGQAALIAPTTVNFKDVKIKNISIGYFEDTKFQPYLEPIYLFDGVATPNTGGSEVTVRFYLPAVDSSQFSN